MITRRRGGAESLNEVSGIIVDTALAIHRELGPGLLETVYEVVMANELRERGLMVERQVAVPIRFKQSVFEEGLHRIVNNFAGPKPNSFPSPRLRASA